MSTSSISSSFDSTCSMPSIPENRAVTETSPTSTTSSADHATTSYIRLCAWPIILILLSICFSGVEIFKQGLADDHLTKTIIGAAMFILSPLLLMCLSYFSRPSDRVSPEPTDENGVEMSAMQSRS